jgi:GNAT superfamily N-acetyltransferase
MEPYSVRGAKPEEQRELTRLCVRATVQTGYDDAFIDRVMPALTITLPLIMADAVQVAEAKSGHVVGVVTVARTALDGIALLGGIFVDPPFWRRGVGRMLFGAAVARARKLKAGALMIYAEPSAEGFYKRLGAIRIGEGPFFFSPDIILPHLIFIAPQDPSSGRCDPAAPARR